MKTNQVTMVMKDIEAACRLAAYNYHRTEIRIVKDAMIKVTDACQDALDMLRGLEK